jgi:hypothetical protein
MAPRWASRQHGAIAWPRAALHVTTQLGHAALLKMDLAAPMPMAMVPIAITAAEGRRRDDHAAKQTS